MYGKAVGQCSFANTDVWQTRVPPHPDWKATLRATCASCRRLGTGRVLDRCLSARTAVKTCTAVRGFERIVALNHGRKVSTVNPNPYSSDTAVPINIQDGRYTLLWDAKAADENAQAEDLESYSSSPGESAMHLVELHANREFAQSDEAQDTGFEWSRGFS